MDTVWKETLWRQFGAAIDMLENALRACPQELWSDRSRQPEVWYMVYHTLFFLDLYLHGTLEGFHPPAPFNLDELDTRGILPERVYTKDELQAYLEHCRGKCRAVIGALADEQSSMRAAIPWLEMSFMELLLYNMRHVQHHSAQLNLILRQSIDSSPGWVSVAQSRL
ncbi:MAG TPA: DinB family protein [Pyrinomonadaceae bacterium]|nr:DinB family protein [Pyrinomonadaceae bacterium]